MPTTVINEFTLEPKAGPPPSDVAAASGGGAAGAAAAAGGAKGAAGGGSGSPNAAREVERVLRQNRHRAMRLWAY